jgi:uncharacterized protein YeaO (DUF488 family)
MSEQLGTAVVALALQDAMNGDAEAWQFLLTPSPVLKLWCDHLELDMDDFNEMMSRLHQERTPERLSRVVKVWKRRTVIEKRGQTSTERTRAYRLRQRGKETSAIQ